MQYQYGNPLSTQHLTTCTCTVWSSRRRNRVKTQEQFTAVARACLLDEWCINTAHNRVRQTLADTSWRHTNTTSCVDCVKGQTTACARDVPCSSWPSESVSSCRWCCSCCSRSASCPLAASSTPRRLCARSSSAISASCARTVVTSLHV